MKKGTGKRAQRNPKKHRGINGNGSNQKGGGGTKKHKATSPGKSGY